MIRSALSHYLRRKMPGKVILAGGLLFPVVVVFSVLVLGSDPGATEDAPGGVFFEAAFWMTAVGAAFLSFIMLEVLFRSRETRILAPWPVPPLDLFCYQMKRVGIGIGISTLYFAAFWLPKIMAAPKVVVLAIAMWPVGLMICAVVSAAIILFVGNSATQNNRNSASDAMSFGMAPAISLAVSLFSILLLKLLAEAILKPGFLNAVLTAVSIVVTLFVVMLAYAIIVYRKRYYAILASFLDSDLVILNAGYAFIDGKNAQLMRKLSDQKMVLARSFVIQFRRRFAVSTLLVSTYAVIFMLFIWNMPQYLGPCVPFAASLALLLFSHPWSAFADKDIHTELLGILPVKPAVVQKAAFRASLEIMAVQAGILSISVLIPTWSEKGLAMGFFYAGLTFLACLVMTCVGCVVYRNRVIV